MKVIKAFELLGFSLVREREHMALIRENPDGTRTPLTLPNHSKIKGCPRTWWIIRPAVSRPTSGRFFVMRQSRETFSSRSQAPSEGFCEYLHPSPRDMTPYPPLTSLPLKRKTAEMGTNALPELSFRRSV